MTSSSTDAPLVALAASVLVGIPGLVVAYFVIRLAVSNGIRVAMRDRQVRSLLAQHATASRSDGPVPTPPATAPAVDNRFIVSGIDKASNTKTSNVYLASTAASARSKGELGGMIVTDVQPV